MPPKASPSIRDQIAHEALRAGGTCPVCSYIDEHPEHADELGDVLADHTITAAAIQRWLRGQGVTIGRQAVPTHRARQCGGLRDGRRL